MLLPRDISTFMKEKQLMNDKTLTVITTTYNRDYCLHQVYESLLRQTSDDFIWLIIDDGSTDNTKEIVQRWKS